MSSMPARSSRTSTSRGDQGERDLRPRLSAVHGPRPAADRQARRRARARDRLRHGRPRLYRQGQRPGPDRVDDRDAGTRVEGDRAGPLMADGPRRGGGTPGSTGSRSRAEPRRAPYSIDDNLWGRSSEGRWIEELDHAPRTTSSSWSPGPRRPRRARGVTSGSSAASRGAERRAPGVWSRCSSAPARSAPATASGSSTNIEDRIVGLKVRDIYEVPAAAILLPAHPELEKLVGTIHQNQLKPTLDQKWAYLVYAGLWWEPLRGGPRHLHGRCPTPR